MYMREVKEKTVDQYHTATRWGSLEEQALSQKKNKLRLHYFHFN